MKERVSALIDGELERDTGIETLSEVSRDAELAKTWQRYHLIGAAFRKEPVHQLDLTERIRAVLDREQDPVPLVTATSRLPQRWPPFAIAASLVAAVIGFQILSDGPDTAPVQNSVALTVSATKWESSQNVDEEMLNELLVEHGEFTPPFGMNGLAAYAKFVSYDTTE